MKKIISLVVFVGMLSSVSVVFAEGVAEGVAEEAPPVEEKTSGWKKARNEIGEAASAVGDATKGTSQKAWKSTKEGSKGAWKAIREGSKETWAKGKGKIHEATADDDAAAKSE